MSSRPRSAVEELPGRLLRAGYHHRAALHLSQSLLLLRRRLALIGFAKAFAAEKDDLGVFDQAVGDGRRDGGVVQDIPPLRKGCVGRDERTSLVAVTSGNDLIEQIRGLLVERKIS